MSEHYLTLGQAAKETGKSKATISDAIKTGRLSVHEKVGNTYKIDPAELFRIYPPKPPEQTMPNGKSTPTEPGLGDIQSKQIAELYEARIADLNKALERAEANAEFLQDQLKRQAHLLTHYQQEEKKQPARKGLLGLFSRAS